jgi:hypothetical protein
MPLWALIVQSTTGSHVEGLTVANVTQQFENIMVRGIAQKFFSSLKTLIFSTNMISTLEFMSFVNAHTLEILNIWDSRVTLLKPLAKMNNSQLKYFLW